MFDINDDAKSSYRRVEVLTGPGRRRHWSAEEKARAVAETLAPGGRVSEVARRWQICPQQVYAWRRAMRSDSLATVGNTAACSAPNFVPIITEAVPAATAASPRSAAVLLRSSLPARWCG